MGPEETTLREHIVAVIVVSLGCVIGSVGTGLTFVYFSPISSKVVFAIPFVMISILSIGVLTVYLLEAADRILGRDSRFDYPLVLVPLGVGLSEFPYPVIPVFLDLLSLGTSAFVALRAHAVAPWQGIFWYLVFVVAISLPVVLWLLRSLSARSNAVRRDDLYESGTAEQRVTINVRQRNGITVVDVTGGANVDWPLLNNRLTELLHAGKTSIIIDLGNLTYINALGLGALVNAVVKARSTGAEIKFIRPSKQVHKALEATGVAGTIEIYSGEAEAAASFGRP